MEFIATTISEHIYHGGLVESEARGPAKGEVNGQINMLKTGLCQMNSFRV